MSSRNAVRWASTVLVACGAFAQRAPGQEPSARVPAVRAAALAELTDAERSFARETVARGQRAGWLRWFAEDGIMYRPGGFVNARTYMAADSSGGRAAPPGAFDWRPGYGDVSVAGDFGYNSGPVKVAGMAEADRYFFSVWRRQSDGNWKVVLDLGTNIVIPDGYGFEAPYVSASSVVPPAQRPSLTVWDIEHDSLDASGVSAWFDPSVRALRSGAPLLLGAEAVAQNARANLAQARFRTLGWGASVAGDMAFTYGTFVAGAGGPSRGAYARAWRRDANGRWRIVFDVMREDRASN